MGKPMLLYGLVDLVNPSFEDAVTPDGWDQSSSVNGIQSIDGNFAQSPGDGIPSVRSLKQNVAGGTGADKAVTRQRFAVDQLPGFVKEQIVEVAAVASLRVARGIADRNAVLLMKQYDATGTATPGTGVLLSHPSERRFSCGGPEWSLRINAQRIHTSAAYLDVELVYDVALGGYDVNAHAYWDRVMVGVLIDFHKGFQSFDMRPDLGYETNTGMGQAETVSIAPPSTKIDIDIEARLDDYSKDAVPLKQFSRYLGRDDVGLMALWLDRDRLTNSDGHFERVYHDPSISIEVPKGIKRRNYNFSFVAPSEAP